MMVKVCGITNVEDALAAVEAGAGALGFVFHLASPRYVPPERAARIIGALPAAVLKVGVFVDQAQAVPGIDVLQLHGIAAAPAGARFWRSIRVGADFDAARLEPAGEEAIVLDTASPTLPGGTGRTWNWNLARGAKQRVIVAGGLDETNVAEAIAAACPWGVDAASRLERAPGIKDHRRVRAFVAAALAAAQELK